MEYLADDMLTINSTDSIPEQFSKFYTLNEIAGYLNQFTPSRVGKTAYGNLSFQRVASLTSAKPSDISFLLGDKHKEQLQVSQAGAVLIAEQHQELTALPAILCQDIKFGFVKLMEFFSAQQHKGLYQAGIAASAIVSQTADIADSVHIGAKAVIGHGCKVGANSIIHAQVTLYPNTIIGKNCIIHSGAVIGGDGFGFQLIQGRWLKVEQLGRVVIGDAVEIGANTTIDRGTLDDTEIADGVKIDNQVHIAHNVKIGKNSLICGCVGIAGSAKIGESCILAGGVGISDNLNIADQVIITAGSPILQSIHEAGSYSSAPPTMPTHQWRRYIVVLKTLADKLNIIYRRLAQLESKIN